MGLLNFVVSLVTLQRKCLKAADYKISRTKFLSGMQGSVMEGTRLMMTRGEVENLLWIQH